MTKRIMSLFLSLLLVCSLAACGNSNDSSSRKDDTSSGGKKGSIFDKLSGANEEDDTVEAVTGEDTTETTEIETTETETETETEAETEAANTVSDGQFPNLYLCYRDITQWEDQYFVIDHDYQALMLDEEYAKTHKGLQDSLNEINNTISARVDEYVAQEQEMLAEFDSTDLQMQVDDGTLPYKESWNIFTRRVDPSILSLVVQYRVPSTVEEVDYEEYRAHTFDVATGEELELSDIVKDEDALFTMLATNMLDEINAEREHYFLEATTVEELKESLKYAKDDNLYTWVLDPQGVSFWFDPFMIMRGAVHGTVLFSQDEDGSIFKDEYRTNVPDEWAMRLPKYVYEYFDAEDDGELDSVIAYESYGEYEREDGTLDQYVTGLTISYGDEVKDFSTDADGGTSDDFDVYLLHKDGKSYILEEHGEFNDFFVDLYELSGRKITLADCKLGCLGMVDESLCDYELDYYIPRYIPVNPSEIDLICESTLVRCVQTEGRYTIEDSKLKGLSDFLPIYWAEGFEDGSTPFVTVKKDVEFATLDENLSETGETVQLGEGDVLNVLYTDNEAYTILEAPDKTLVRVDVYFDGEEYARYVQKPNGEREDIYEIFDFY